MREKAPYREASIVQRRSVARLSFGLVGAACSALSTKVKAKCTLIHIMDIFKCTGPLDNLELVEAFKSLKA